jgi:hypothetical protein
VSQSASPEAVSVATTAPAGTSRHDEEECAPSFAGNKFSEVSLAPVLYRAVFLCTKAPALLPFAHKILIITLGGRCLSVESLAQRTGVTLCLLGFAQRSSLREL